MTRSSKKPNRLDELAQVIADTQRMAGGNGALRGQRPLPRHLEMADAVIQYEETHPLIPPIILEAALMTHTRLVTGPAQGMERKTQALEAALREVGAFKGPIR